MADVTTKRRVSTKGARRAIRMIAEDEENTPQDAFDFMETDHADEVGHGREQFGGAAEQRLRPRAGRQFLPQVLQFAFAERLQLQQRIDEHAIALRGGHAPGRGVRRGQQPGILQLGQDVADGRRTHVQARVPGQRLRAHRLAVADVAGNQRAQQLPGARVERGFA